MKFNILNMCVSETSKSCLEVRDRRKLRDSISYTCIFILQKKVELFSIFHEREYMSIGSFSYIYSVLKNSLFSSMQVFFTRRTAGIILKDLLFTPYLNTLKLYLLTHGSINTRKWIKKFNQKKESR